MYRLNLIIGVVVFTLIVTGILPWAAVAGSESQSSIEQTFQKAKRDYLDKNLNAAAEQIQKGAVNMKAEAAKASVKGKAALTASAQELEKLADDVKKGIVTSVKGIEEAFARAYVALASDSHIKSTEAWTKKQAAKAGDALDSATKYLERSLAWAGQKVEASTKEAIKKSEDVSLKLKKKGSVVAEEVGKGLKDMGNEIEKFGKRISPK
jgi:valyl-tRNA synthetase